jgi:hypothetical protein
MADEAGFEPGGEAQAAGDAGEDERDVDGVVEVGETVGGHAGAALLQDLGDFVAEMDELADDVEQTGGAGGVFRAGGGLVLGGTGVVGGVGGLEGGGHERNKNMKGGAVSRNLFSGFGEVAAIVPGR